MKNNAFNKLFTRRELSEIRGQQNRNYIILISILTATFTAITIADGGLDYLRLKMSDPFVKNLDVKIPYEVSGNVASYKFFLNQDSLKQRFLYDTVMSHVELALGIWDNIESEYSWEKGRSIENKNPVLNQILHKSNLEHGRGFSDEFDYGFIVTRKLLKDHGYEEDAHFIHMAMPRPIEGFYKAPVPIIAVVEELPGLSSFAYTPYFYSARNTGWDNPFITDQYKSIDLFLPGSDTAKIMEVKNALREIVSTKEAFLELDPYVEQTRYEYTYESGTLYSVSFYPEPYSEEEVESLYQELINSEELQSIKIDLQRCYYYRMPGVPGMEPAWDMMSFMFSKLRHVTAFKDFLYDNYQLEVEMSKVRDKENFKAISFLTISMAIILLIFSVFSVALFVFNLLRNHLSKITINLGTFKAFGMSNKEIKSIYRSIIRRFCLSSIGIALGTVFILDALVVGIFLKELHLWHMLNIFTFVAIAAIVISVEWTVKRTSNSILENTPGDLIYGRDKN